MNATTSLVALLFNECSTSSVALLFEKYSSFLILLRRYVFMDTAISAAAQLLMDRLHLFI